LLPTGDAIFDWRAKKLCPRKKVHVWQNDLGGE